MLRDSQIPIYLFSTLFAASIAYILYAANTGKELLFFELVDKIPMGDKLAHIVLIGTLAFLSDVLLGAKVFRVKGIQMLVGSFAVFMFITIEEFTQLYIPTRNFDWGDLIANYIGIGIASYVVLRLKKRENNTQ